MWQGFGNRVWEREAAGVASVRRHQKLPPCQIEPVLAGLKAGPISDIGNPSVIKHSRRGKKCCTAGVRKYERNNYADTKVGEEGGGGGAPGAKAEIPLKPTVKTKEAVAFGDPMLEQAPGRSCSLRRGACIGAG